MIISPRIPRDAKGVKRDLKYWVCMNNGRPIIGAKKVAAEFYGEIVDKAVRQVSTLFPGAEVQAVDRAIDLRKRKKSIATELPLVGGDVAKIVGRKAK